MCVSSSRAERMQTNPTPRAAKFEAPADPVDRVSGIARRIGGRILHELREALPPTIFFFIGFNFVVLTTNLLVAEYAVAVSNFMLATLAALIVGKAVLT